MRSIKSQCEDAGVAFYFKQWGEWVPVERVSDCSFMPLRKYERWLNLEGAQWPKGDALWLMRRIGVHEAGRVLGAQVFDQVPAS